MPQRQFILTFKIDNLIDNLKKAECIKELSNIIN